MDTITKPPAYTTAAAAIHREQQQRLCEAISGDGVIVLPGYQKMQLQHDMAAPFWQEANFLWLTGVTYPSSGEVSVDGRVSALLELTSGFDPELTGRENIFLRGRLLGLKEEEIKEVEKDIELFAELGDYIDQPVRTYSSGMKARLGFSVNVNIKPEILIIDEALSVGDVDFRKKCVKKVSEIMSDDDVTLLFVTHSVSTAKEFCKRGILLKNGKKIFDGNIDKAIELYNK